jgi:hypothetical protein
MYERVIREATQVDDLRSYLNETVLRQVWALAGGYYAWGGEDTDMGAIIGSRPDERQASLQMTVTALQGKVMAGAAGPIFMIVVLGKAAWWPKLDVWPFAIPLVLAGVSGLVGWVIYRERGDGDDPVGAHAGQAGPRVPVRHL